MNLEPLVTSLIIAAVGCVVLWAVEIAARAAYKPRHLRKTDTKDDEHDDNHHAEVHL